MGEVRAKQVKFGLNFCSVQTIHLTLVTEYKCLSGMEKLYVYTNKMVTSGEVILQYCLAIEISKIFFWCPIFLQLQHHASFTGHAPKFDREFGVYGAVSVMCILMI